MKHLALLDLSTYEFEDLEDPRCIEYLLTKRVITFIRPDLNNYWTD